MPEKPPVVLLTNVRWDALWEYSHVLATLFADAGYPTVFVETTGMRNPPLGITTGRRVLQRLLRARRSGGKKPASLSPNLTVYSPLVVPPTRNPAGLGLGAQPPVHLFPLPPKLGGDSRCTRRHRGDRAATPYGSRY